MKKVLVTGAAGFLGSNLVTKLIEEGHGVVGLDNLAPGSEGRLRPCTDAAFRFVKGDVRDAGAVRKAAEGVQCVIHLAEVKIPRYGNSLETLEVNVEGTENVLEAAVAQDASVILGSTDEVYGKNREMPLNEESASVMGQPTVNRWSLGVSKLMAEHLCLAYREKHGVRTTILRYFGGYGPGQSLDWQGGAPSMLITAALKEESIPIHGDGLQSRTFTHVDDLVNGTLLAIGSPYAEGEILNIAGRDVLSIINLAYMIWRLVGNSRKPEFEFLPYSDFSRNYEDVEHREADISKAHYLLGYEPSKHLGQGLSETIRWQAGQVGE